MVQPDAADALRRRDLQRRPGARIVRVVSDRRVRRRVPTRASARDAIRARLRVAAPAESVRSDRLSDGQRGRAPIHVAVPVQISRPDRAARRAPAPRPGRRPAHLRTHGGLPRRVHGESSGSQPGPRRARGVRLPQLSLLLLADDPARRRTIAPDRGPYRCDRARAPPGRARRAHRDDPAGARRGDRR